MNFHLLLRNTGCHFVCVSAVQCKTSPAVVRQASKCAVNSYNPINLEESTCSYRTRSYGKLTSRNGKEDRSYSDNLNAHDATSEASKCNQDAAENLSHGQIVAFLGSHALDDKFEVSGVEFQ